MKTVESEAKDMRGLLKDVRFMQATLEQVALFLTSGFTDEETEEMWEAETLEAVRRALKRAEKYCG